MHRKMCASLLIVTGLGIAGMAVAQDMGGMKMPMSPPATQPTGPAMPATDVRNTVCPVSGEQVGESKLDEVYHGKVYHLCCADCPKDFEKDPAKFEKAVSADPAKYGIK